jgi:hypothetical protein
MPRLILFFILFVGLKAEASGIDSIPFARVDSLTYALYLKGDWKGLKLVGDKLIDHQIDWYYLRLRLTEAELQLNHPSIALNHIAKAERFSGRSEFTNTLLVRSSLLLNNYRQALLYATRDTSSFYSHFLKQNRLFKECEAEGIFKRSSNTELGSLTGFRLGANSYVGHRFSVYFSGQYYTQTNTKRDSTNRSTKVDIHQSQYYSKINVVCSSQIAAFFGGQFSSTSIGNTSQKNYLAFGGVEIFKPFVKYKFSAASTDFNGTDKIISSLTVTAFPLANTTLYPWVGVSNIYDVDSSVNNTIVDFGVGANVANNLWIDIYATPMAYDFHTISDYEVTFNLQDRVNFKVGSGISYYGIKNIGLKLNYILEYMRITGIPQIKNYTQNTITLCLNWYR